MGTYKNCLEGEAYASCVQQQWLKWIVKGFSLSVHVYRYLHISIHICVQTFLEKAWFHGLVPSALKRLLFNYVRRQSGQKSNQVINRAPVSPRAERSYSSVAFWERVKKPSRRKKYSLSLTESVYIFGKMADVCQDSDWGKPVFHHFKCRFMLSLFFRRTGRN